MNRRKFFKATGSSAVAVGMMSLPLSLQASDEEKQVFMDVGISSNHGHELKMSMAQVVELFGKTKHGEVEVLSIQGRSGHPHTIELTQELLVELMAEKELNLESSVDAGHAHGVSITLEVLD